MILLLDGFRKAYDRVIAEVIETISKVEIVLKSSHAAKKWESQDKESEKAA